MTNALLHTESSPSLRLAREGDDVRVVVLDGSAVAPVRRQHGPTATTGRGLQLLESLAAEWGWESEGAGKAVWALVRGAPPAPPPSAPPVPPPPAAPPAPPVARSLASEEVEPVGSPSPMGRYAGTGGGAGEVEASLLGVPVRVFAVARDHHDDLLREFRLLALSGPRPSRGGSRS